MADAREDLLDQRLVLGETGAAIGCDLVAIARSLVGSGAHVPHIHQKCQRRVDRTGARTIGAAGALLDGANDVVAVTRLLADEGQHDVSQLPVVEEPLSLAAPVSVAAPRAICRHTEPRFTC